MSIRKGMSPEATYATIRDEILDQKKCQFQMFSLAVTATAALLAYAAGSGALGIVYLAPLVLNDCALIIILDKAISIQSKVGYLQLMEQNWTRYEWVWETHLDSFRLEVLLRAGAEAPRKHGFVTTVGLLLVGLNALASTLAVFQAIKAKNLSSPSTLFPLILGLVFLLGGMVWLWYQRYQLICGRHSGLAIAATWKRVLQKKAIDEARVPNS